MKHKKIIAANWKMYLTHKEAISLMGKIENHFSKNAYKNVETIVCPSADALGQYSIKKQKRYMLGAQDVSEFDSGAYTGDISSTSLSQLQVKYCIIGHSERRAMGENYVQVNRKMSHLIKSKITPIICVGESKKERNQGMIDTVISAQLSQAMKGITLSRSQKIVIAYEPIWAISGQSGKPCDPEEANRVIGMIKKKLKKIAALSVLYGGSVDAKNIASYAMQEHIDGFLIGSASTSQSSLTKMIKQIDTL